VITLALTGGAATGKSAVAEGLCRRWGDSAAFFSADEAVRELLTKPGIKTSVAEVFGEGVFDAVGDIDRGKLRRVVFRGESLRRKLEDILHPGVQALGREVGAVAIRDQKKFFVYEIPLLYETGSRLKRDFDVVVASSAETQRRRLVEKRGLEPEIIDNLLKAQMPLDQKMARADFVIWNDATERELQEQVFFLADFLDQADGPALLSLS